MPSSSPGVASSCSSTCDRKIMPSADFASFMYSSRVLKVLSMYALMNERCGKTKKPSLSAPGMKSTPSFSPRESSLTKSRGGGGGAVDKPNHRPGDLHTAHTTV